MTATPRPMLLAALFLVGGAALVGVRQATPPFARFASATPVVLIPTVSGEPEYCLTCHGGIEEISAAHPTQVFGCVRCHGGQPLALDEQTAHAGLFGGRNPSTFDIVEAGCGGSDCHSGPAEDGLDHIHRSRVSLQSTYAGAIAAVRQAFGSQSDREAHFALASIADPEVTSPTGLLSLEAFLPIAASEPAQVQAFAERCLTCHLGSASMDRPGYRRLRESDAGEPHYFGLGGHVAADADLLVRLVAPPSAGTGLREAEPDARGGPQTTGIAGG